MSNGRSVALLAIGAAVVAALVNLALQTFTDLSLGVVAFLSMACVAPLCLAANKGWLVRRATPRE